MDPDWRETGLEYRVTDVEIDTGYVVLCYLTNNILCGMRSLVSGFITLIIPWRQLDH